VNTAITPSPVCLCTVPPVVTTDCSVAASWWVNSSRIVSGFDSQRCEDATMSVNTIVRSTTSCRRVLSSTTVTGPDTGVATLHSTPQYGLGRPDHATKETG